MKLESFEPTSKPKVIKEVKAMVPNLTLIEVPKSSVARILAGNPYELFLFSRRRSLLSRCQRSLRRTCQRKMQRSSRSSLRVSEPSLSWSRPGWIPRSTYPLPLHSPTQLRLAFKTYLPSAQFNARIMSLALLEAIYQVARPWSGCSPPLRESNKQEFELER